MATIDIQSIIEKIQKLFRMADKGSGASENEISMANAAIKRLLAEHNLSQADIRVKSASSVTEADSADIMKGGKWDRELRQTIDAICGVKHYYRGYAKNFTCVYVGDADDVQVALALYIILKKAIFSLKYKYFKECKENGTYASRGSYLLGVTSRMHERAKEAAKMETPKAQEQYGALMVIKGKEIADFLKTKNLTSSRIRRTSLHGESYRRGLQDGNSVGLNARNTLT